MPATATPSGTTVPLFFPGETTPRDVPYEEMHDNVTKYGAKPGVIMKFKDDPDQKPRAVPADQVLDAAKNGGSIVPLVDQSAKQSGFWANIYENTPLKGIVESAKQMYSDPDQIEALPYHIVAGMVNSQVNEMKKGEELRQQGHTAEGLAHSAMGRLPIVGPILAQGAENVGTLLGQKNYAGAAGAGIGTIATLAAPKIAEEAAPLVSGAADTLTSTTKMTAPVRAVVRGTNKALANAPGVVGGAVGAGIGGKIGGQAGAELGMVAGGLAGRELLPQVKLRGEGFGLPNRVAGGPVDAPEFSPPAPPPPAPRTPGWQQGGPAAPSPAPVEPPLTRAELQSVLDARRAAARASSPAAATPASTPVLTPATPKAALASIQQQLNDAMGGKPLQPGIPLRDQLQAAIDAKTLPKGFTPVDSSALKGFKYDPATREFESVTQGGQRYVHGDVSPEEAQSFADAESKGKAWQAIRNNPLVAKVINGKRIAVKPAEMQSASGVTPKSDAGMADLTTDWSKALEDVKAKQADRRVDVTTRQKVTEMSPDEMRKTLLTSDKVDLPNRRAFEESNSPVVGMSDADALKAFNDTHGYEAGDALLKAKAEALQKAGVEAYHDKGDEFLYRANSPEELRTGLEKAREIFKNSWFEHTLPDGTVKTFKGTDFSYGIGKELNQAENGLKAAKAARKAAGTAVERGNVRGIVEK